MLDGEFHTLRSEVESLIAWWREAGVDTLIDEKPRDWLGEAKLASVKAVIKPGTVPAGAEPVPLPPRRRAPLPTRLADFLVWLATENELLNNYPVRQRLAPEGDPSNTPMIITDVPERGDAEAGRLLTGDVGGLFDKMLAAWKIDRSKVYLAALAPSRPAGALMDEKSLEFLAPFLLHHIRLVAPKKLWLMGEAASRAVLGTNVAEATGRLHTINYDGVTVEAIATLHPRVLLHEPNSKARVWADMQRLMGDVKA